MAAQADDVPWSSPTLHVILASTLMGVMGVSLISPALPAVREALDLTEAQASLVLSAFTLPGIVLGPVLGVMADRYGRRRILIPSLLLYGVSGAAVTLVSGLPAVLALRFVQGSAAAGLVTLAITLVGDLFAGPQRNAIMGANGAVLSVGTAAYPLLGGALSTIDWRAPFLVYLAGVPVGLFALRVLDEPALERHTDGSYLGGALEALPTLRAVGLYGTGFVVFVLLYGGVLTTLPFLLDAEMGLSEVAIGAVLTVSSFFTGAASSQNGRLARHFSNGALVSAGLVLLGVSFVGLWSAPSPGTVAISITFFGAGMGVLMPSLDTAVSHLVPDRFRGGAMSLRTSVVRLGQTVGPLLFAVLVGVWGYRLPLLMGGLVAIALGGVGLVWVPTRSPGRS